MRRRGSTLWMATVASLLCLQGSGARRSESNEPPIEDVFGAQRRLASHHHRQPGHGAASQASSSYLPMPSKERKPNIVLILTDDQDVELGEFSALHTSFDRISRATERAIANFQHLVTK